MVAIVVEELLAWNRKLQNHQMKDFEELVPALDKLVVALIGQHMDHYFDCYFI